jgi:hypothetical protein
MQFFVGNMRAIARLCVRRISTSEKRMQTTDNGSFAKHARRCSESSRGIDGYTDMFLALMPTHSSLHPWRQKRRS